MHVRRICTAIIAGLMLTATACSILPDSGKSTYAIAQEATECQLGNDPNKNLNQSQGGMCICLRRGIVPGVSRECFGP